jgi:D-threo-aldose 1-dehydrogenase
MDASNLTEKAIAVPGIRIKIPVLGFGCSSLTGTGRKDADRLLGTAFDAGVRHFDVARYYGYGEAERILGTFLKTRRAEVTITTKFGIDAPQKAGALRIALQTGRQVVRLLPAARKVMQRSAQTFVKSGKFSAADARASLETSLRELGTDYIDFFLLHDYTADDPVSQETVAFLEDAVKTGKIRYFGLGTGIDSIVRTLATQSELCKVIQFENSVVIRNTEKLPPNPRVQLVITHGALSASFRSISTFLKAHPDIAKEWSEALGVDCANDDSLSALLLNFAVDANPGGLVLFSSKNAARVARNINAVLRPELAPEQASLFGQLVEGISNQLTVES